MKRIGVMLVLCVLLAGCAGVQVNPAAFGTSARDITKATVDTLCPAPKVGDVRGSFEAAFFERYMKNRGAVELSQQDVIDIQAFKDVCAKPLASRTDYDYGTLAGGAVDRIAVILFPRWGSYLGLLR